MSEHMREERNRLAAECRRLQEEINQRREAMHAADTVVAEAAAFLDRMAVCLHRKWDRNEPDIMLELHRHGDDCRAQARKLRGET